MRRKIIAMIGLALICVAAINVQAVDDLELEDGENVAIKDVYVRAKLTNDTDKPMVLYVWVVFNELAETYGNDLRINISVDGDIIADTIPIGMCKTDELKAGETADDIQVAEAYTYEDYGTYANGSHTVRVEFVNIKNDDRSQDNAKEVSFTAPSEWYSFISNGFIWSTLYTIDGAIDKASEATGLDFLADIPVIQIIAGIVILIVIILFIRWYRKKKSKNFRTGKSRVPPRGGYKPSYAYTKAYQPPPPPPPQYDNYQQYNRPPPYQ